MAVIQNIYLKIHTLKIHMLKLFDKCEDLKKISISSSCWDSLELAALFLPRRYISSDKLISENVKSFY